MDFFPYGNKGKGVKERRIMAIDLTVYWKWNCQKDDEWRSVFNRFPQSSTEEKRNRIKIVLTIGCLIFKRIYLKVILYYLSFKCHLIATWGSDWPSRPLFSCQSSTDKFRASLYTPSPMQGSYGLGWILGTSLIQWYKAALSPAPWGWRTEMLIHSNNYIS